MRYKPLSPLFVKGETLTANPISHRMRSSVFTCEVVLNPPIYIKIIGVQGVFGLMANSLRTVIALELNIFITLSLKLKYEKCRFCIIRFVLIYHQFNALTVNDTGDII